MIKNVAYLFTKFIQKNYFASLFAASKYRENKLPISITIRIKTIAMNVIVYVCCIVFVLFIYHYKNIVMISPKKLKFLI